MAFNKTRKSVSNYIGSVEGDKNDIISNISSKFGSIGSLSNSFDQRISDGISDLLTGATGIRTSNIPEMSTEILEAKKKNRESRAKGLEGRVPADGCSIIKNPPLRFPTNWATENNQPSNLHPFSILNRILNHKTKNLVLKILRPWSEVGVITGWKSYYHYCNYYGFNLNEDEDEIYDPIYDKLNMDLDKKLKEILDKNRKETNWTKAKPALRPMQDKYVEAMKKFKESNKPADFKVAKKQKDLILKHYKPSDVPRV